MPKNSMLALFELRCLVMESGDCVTEDLDLCFQPNTPVRRYNVCAFPFANISSAQGLSSVLLVRPGDGLPNLGTSAPSCWRSVVSPRPGPGPGSTMSPSSS
jgi:hypothetical protein